MEENKPQSVFGTSWEELEQESRRVRSEPQGRTLTMDEYKGELREKLRGFLEDELRKTPQQRAEEGKSSDEGRAWFAKTTEQAQKARERFLKPRRHRWPIR